MKLKPAMVYRRGKKGNKKEEIGNKTSVAAGEIHQEGEAQVSSCPEGGEDWSREQR